MVRALVVIDGAILGRAADRGHGLATKCGGVVDLLPGCLPFNGGAKPIPQKGRDQNYMNLKGQCSYELAQYVNDREMYIAETPHRERVEEELSHIKRYKMDMDGKLRVLPKEKVKESLGRSPDFADVMMMRMMPELRGDSMISASIQRKGVSIRKAQMKQAFIDSWR